MAYGGGMKYVFRGRRYKSCTHGSGVAHRRGWAAPDFQWLAFVATCVITADICFTLLHTQQWRAIVCFISNNPAETAKHTSHVQCKDGCVNATVSSIVQYWQLLVDAVMPNQGATMADSEPACGSTLCSSVLAPQTVYWRNTFRHRLILPTSGFTTCSSLGDIQRQLGVFSNASASRGWHVLYLLWMDAARYSVNVYEVRSLLLRPTSDCAGGVRCGHGKVRGGAKSVPASNVAVLQRDTEESIYHAGVNLALLWYLELVRRIYEAIIDGDTQRCADELDELDKYAAVLRRRWIAPFAKHERRCASTRNATATSELTCAPLQCWAVLTITLRRLRIQRRVRAMVQIRSLFCYLHTSAAPRLVAFVGMGLMTRLSSRLTSLGPALHEAMRQLLRLYVDAAFASSHTLSCSSDKTPERVYHSEGGLAAHATLRAIAEQVVICGACEVLRFGLDAVLLQVTQQVIHTVAARRREHMKAALYNALTRLPLTFYDTHSYEEVEEMVYYTNDIEGVDVQLHRFLFSVGRAVLGMRCALAVLPRRSRLCVVGAVTASVLLGVAGKFVARRYRRWCGGGVGVTRDEVENRDSARERRRDGILLRGLEIIAALPQLRPYGADVALMRWWNAHSARFGTDGVVGDYHHCDEVEDGANDDHNTNDGPAVKAKTPTEVLRRFICGPLQMWMRQLHTHLWPALGLGLLVTSQWFVKTAAVVYATTGVPQPRGEVTAGVVGRRVVLYQSVADAMRAVELTWSILTESGQIAEVVVRQAYKADVIYRLLDAQNWERNSDVAPPNALSYGDSNYHEVRPSSSPSFATRSHKPLLLSNITIHQLHFRYPAAPTVEVFSPALSLTLRLFDPTLRRGRLVCITGRSGCGKSTLLALLLGLYEYTAVTNHGRVAADALGLCTTDLASPVVSLPPSSIVLSFLSCGACSPGTQDEVAGDAGRGHTADGSCLGCVVRPVPLSHIPRDVLRRRLFSYVPQQPTLLVGATLAHNITLASRVSLTSEALLAEARRCARLARCDFVDRLPQGLLTRLTDGVTGGAESSDAVGDRPVRLSSGQGQRLMLARALYHGGAVLLMDEPTANLDRITTSELLAEWQRLLRDRIVHGIICCTHDDAVMSVADDVVTL